MSWPLDALPQVVRADRFSLQDRHFSTQYHGPTTSLHLYDYYGTMRLGELEFPIAPRVLTLSPAGIVSSYHLPRPGYHWCIHFETPVLSQNLTHLPVRLELGERADPVIAQLASIARLHALSFRGGAPGQTAAAAASAALQALLLQLALSPDDQQPASRTTADAAIEHLLTLINERLEDDLRVPDLARQVGLSQNYLARCFRQTFGCTIPRYILRRRIDVARQLLRDTDQPVKAIAGQVGLPDAQHFNKQFRRFTSLSPTSYRDHHHRAHHE